MGPSGGGLANQALQALWPKLTGLEWLHTFAAGQDKLWFPKLVNSSVTVTNGQVSLITVHRQTSAPHLELYSLSAAQRVWRSQLAMVSICPCRIAAAAVRVSRHKGH